MPPSPDVYALLSSLFQQTARAPDAPPVIPLDRWPAGSQERRLLEDLQAALAALQDRGQGRESQAEEKERQNRSIFEAASDGLIINDMETGLVVEANPAASAMHGYAREEFIGLHPTVFTHPNSHRMFSEYAHAVQSGGVFEAQAVHVRRDGSPFYVEVRGTAFTYHDRPCVLGVFRDVSERVQAERLLQQRVEARTREQSTLLDISQTLASALEVQPGLILDQLRVLIDYTHALLFTLQDSTLVALAVRGPQRLEQAMPFRIRLDGPETLTALFNGGRPNRIADVWSTDPAAQFLRSLLTGQAAMLLEEMRAWMWVPLSVTGRVIGAVSVAHTAPDTFTAHHADLALTIANQAAIAMVNAELHEQAQTLAALQERQRLARNLHDAVNQSLFSAGLIAEVLPRLWERNPDEGRRSLEDLRRLTRGALAEMRALLAELRPSVLTDTDLGDLLRQLGNALTGRTNIPVAVTVVGEGTLPAEVQVALYRVCQEGLSNIAKHAAANQVAIHLQVDAGAVELRIRDDGRGFDPERVSPGRSGLSIMRERAEAVGAVLLVTSQPGHGTEIAVRWTEVLQQEAR
ncbi:MAG TPA: PAS domain S-box protein [Anaerolineae bacterium]